MLLKLKIDQDLKKYTDLNEDNESLHIIKSTTAVDNYRLRVCLQHHSDCLVHKHDLAVLSRADYAGNAKRISTDT